MRLPAATVALVAGYVLAVPFTLVTPGFLRLWRRRERWAYGAAQGGAALITAGWAARGRPGSAAVNGAWLVGFGLLYAAEGRRRARAALPPASGAG